MKCYMKIIFLMVILFFTKTFSGTNQISINGTVYDEKGQPIENAEVVIVNINQGTVTDSKGRFSFPPIPRGVYIISVNHMGFQGVNRKIDVNNKKNMELDFRLKETALPSEPVIITGNPSPSLPENTLRDVSYINGKNKFRKESASLGKTIESLPGVYNLATGSAAGKPMIRGQTGERIRVLSDGISQEYQQYGERHAPNVESYQYERIEIIKGAASLLYGSDALGGAVNLVPRPFYHNSSKNNVFSSSVMSSYQSNNGEWATGFKFNGSLNNLVFNGSLLKRNAGDFHTPEDNTFQETQKKGDPKFTGKINHTDYEQLNGDFAVGYYSPIGLFSFRYDQYYNKNNFLLPTGKPIGLRLKNNNYTIKSIIPLRRWILKTSLAFQDNQRQAAKPGQSEEVLPDSANVDLNTEVITGRMEMEHVKLHRLSGTIGGEIKHYDHQNKGKVPLQPDGHFDNYALFAFEEIDFAKNTFSFGARYDIRSQNFEGSDTNPLLSDDHKKDYESFSGSVGYSAQLFPYLVFQVNLSRGFRTPSFYNLYVYGYHGGIFAYQIGNPDLKNEESLDLNTTIKFKKGPLDITLSGYRNRIDHYIYLYNAPDHPLAPANEMFVFAHDQADALLKGVEINLQYDFLDKIILKANYSALKSEFLSGKHEGEDLPLMPANRLIGEIEYFFEDYFIFKSPYLGFHCKYTGDKKIAGEYEPFSQFDDKIGPEIPFGTASTDDYTLFGLNAGFDLKINNQAVSLNLSATNIFNESYRDFLDTYKGYALGASRSVNIKANWRFN